ncbi:MAG TPA: GH92 family glycosyl hydrolase [Candidatus Eremiobacteraceae bacterium]
MKNKLAIALLLTCSVSAVAPRIAAAQIDPVTEVDPLVGTSGNGFDGATDTFPGADVPFGMVQWSPDTTSQPAGGGYSYNDSAITGFSLTHLSGPGCNVFGDVGILPTTGAITDPARASQPFSHASETAQPGYYAIETGMPGVFTQLTATTRTGLGRFIFPATPQANFLVNASSNQAGVGDAHVAIVGDDEIEGSATGGWFCGMPGSYTVYFALRFDRAFASHGTWRGTRVMPQTGEASGVGAGAWATFDATEDPVVRIEASVSWVSIAGAEANLRAEATSWDFDRVRVAAAASWKSELSRVNVDGGTESQRRIFYTALYHTLLHPNVFSDANGTYRGFDGEVHNAAKGHAEYATFSGWDIYRTEIPLLAVLEPARTSDMMRSLVDAAAQMGWLPKWSLVNVETGVMGGDPSDPMIAGAYAFGARDFDARSALAAMVKGATQTGGTPGQGWYAERPGLDDYLSRGYVVNVHTTNVAPLANGASLTLEYSLDDFAIAQLAKYIGDQDVYRTMMSRAQNWSNIFDQSTGLIAPRDPDGAFVATPLTEAGQSGFQEGNAEQYTWMVPQNLAGLVDGMGGRANTVAKLDDFFTQLDANQDKPYAWMGNEPSIGSPWAYLSVGAPWKAQRVIRDAMTQLWGDTPDGIPGNDDLGTMSAWYVWCALGLYPQYPAAPILDLGAPTFPHVSVRVPNGASIDIIALGATSENAYVESVLLDGKLWQKSWTGFSVGRPLRLAFVVGSTPNKAWGASQNDVPPSFSLSPVHFPPSTEAAISITPAGELDLPAGGTSALRVDVSNAGTVTSPISWQATVPDGFVMTPSNGKLVAAAGAGGGLDVQLAIGPRVANGLYSIAIAGQTEGGAQIPRAVAVVRVARRPEDVRLSYIANFFDNNVEALDMRTQTAGVPIAAGEEPRDLAVSPDGRRIYVTDQGTNTVSVIDTGLQKIVATVAVGKTPWGVGIAPDGATVWVANNGDDTVQPIDTATLQTGPPIAVGHNPEMLKVSSDGTLLYVADPGSDDVTPVDLHRRAALAAIPVGMRPRGIVLSHDGKMIYASNYGSASVSAIDLATNKALTEIRVGTGPRGLAISPDGTLLYVANFGAGTVSAIDIATNLLKRTIPVGLNPVAIAFDATGRTAYVVNQDDNDCVPIDVLTGSVGSPIRIGDRPLAISQ